MKQYFKNNELPRVIITSFDNNSVLPVTPNNLIPNFIKKNELGIKIYKILFYVTEDKIF